MLAQDSRPWTGIQWLGDHIIPKVKMLLCTWMLTGRTYKIRAWTPPPHDYWIKHGLQEGRSSQDRHASALLLLVFVSCKLLFLLPAYMLLFSVTFTIADVLGKCGMNLGETLLRQGGRMKIHPTRNRSLCSVANANCFGSEDRGEKWIKKGDKTLFPKGKNLLDKEIPSTNVGSYWWQDEDYV